MEKEEKSVKDIAHEVGKIFEQNGWEVNGTSERLRGVQLSVRNPEIGYQTNVNVSENYIMAREFDVKPGNLPIEEDHSPLPEGIAEYARERSLGLASGYLIDFYG